MSIPYTYWQESDCYWLGYWNDCQEHMTQGRTLVELRRMLRPLRADIMEMIAYGTWSESPRSVGAMDAVPRHREIDERRARSIIRKLSAPKDGE